MWSIFCLIFEANTFWMLHMKPAAKSRGFHVGKVFSRYISIKNRPMAMLPVIKMM